MSDENKKVDEIGKIIQDFGEKYDMSSQSIDFIKRNKKNFSFLYDNMEEVIKELDKLSVEKIILFDEIEQYRSGRSYARYDESSGVILNILNVTKLFNEQSISQVVVFSEAESKTLKYNQHYAFKKSCNLVMTHLNPFLTRYMFQDMINIFTRLDVKPLSEEERVLVFMFESRISESANSLKVINKKIKETESSLIYNKSEVSNLKRELDKQIQDKVLLMEGAKMDITKFFKSIEDVKKNPFLKKFEIEGNDIIFDFGRVEISSRVEDGVEEVDGMKVPKTKVEKFVIGDIKIVASNGSFRCINYNNFYNDEEYDDDYDRFYNHPHADAEGVICFGSKKDYAYELLRQGRFVELANFLYSWTISYNPDDCYSKIDNWITSYLFKNSSKEIKGVNCEDYVMSEW